ncbi:MAG: tetratricopeptide repeat protein [Stellaceae bacterium]
MISVIVGMLGIPTTAHSISADVTEQTLAAAQAAAARHDYAAERKLLLPLAEQGSAVAQYNLGIIYAKGEGVPTDYPQAVHWFREAADQELAPAQYAMGLAYAHGQGVPKDNAQALRWLRLAAQQGNALAQAGLKIMIANGYGAEPSPAAVAGTKSPWGRTMDRLVAGIGSVWCSSLDSLGAHAEPGCEPSNLTHTGLDVLLVALLALLGGGALAIFMIK